MTDFTPGPWEVDMEPVTVHVAGSIWGHGNPVGYVSNVSFCPDEITRAEAAANARLLAAAPDLLAACRSALERSNMWDQPAFDSLHAKLRNAIAKAEGREP